MFAYFDVNTNIKQKQLMRKAITMKIFVLFSLKHMNQASQNVHVKEYSFSSLAFSFSELVKVSLSCYINTTDTTDLERTSREKLKNAPINLAINVVLDNAIIVCVGFQTKTTFNKVRAGMG